MSSVLPLREKQLPDLAFMIREKRCGILHDPGVGKTPPVCVFAYYLWSREQRRTVIVQPSSIMEKNYEEFFRFTPFERGERDSLGRPKLYDPGAITLIEGTRQQKNHLMQSDAKVFIMTADEWRDHWQEYVAYHPDIQAVIGDEWHKLYISDKAKRTQELYQYFSLNRQARLVAMTGSLIKGRLNSAYPLIRLIDGRYYANEDDFLNFHAERDEYGSILYWKNHDRIAKIMGRHAIRRTFTEEYGPAAKVMFMEPVTMKPKMLAAYKEFHDRACLELENSILMGTEPGVMALRARQIMSHPESFGLCQGEVSAKDELLDLHLEDMLNGDGDGRVIFTSLVPETERLAELVDKKGIKVGMMNGKVPSHIRRAIDKDYRARRLDAVVSTWDVADVGFNWERTSDVHAQSLGYDDTNFMQGIRRGIRGERATNLKVWVPEYRSSMDQKLQWAIERKSRDAHKVDPTVEIISFKKEDGNPSDFLLAY